MRLILDASAAVEVALSRSRARQFESVLEDADEVLAPDLIVPEVVNTIWKYHQFERLNIDVCDRALEFAFGLIDLLVPGKELYREAFLLALQPPANRPATCSTWRSHAARTPLFSRSTQPSRRKLGAKAFACCELDRIKGLTGALTVSTD